GVAAAAGTRAVATVAGTATRAGAVATAAGTTAGAGAVATVAGTATGAGAAAAGGVRATEQADRGTADVDRYLDRHADLVAGGHNVVVRRATEVGTRGTAGARAAAGRRGVAEQADRVAGDGDRRLDRRGHLVAAQDAEVVGGTGGVGGSATDEQEAGGENADLERLANPSLHCGYLPFENSD